MKRMAGRKRHSAEDIVRKLRRADELTAEGKTGEEIAAELGVSPATLYNWRRAYGGMDTDAAKELKELREQNARLKRLLAEAELVKDALWEVAKGNSEPNCQAPRRRHAQGNLGHVGRRPGARPLGWPAPLIAASRKRRPRLSDADMRAWLRSYATKNPCHGFRRAWAALRYDERREVKKKTSDSANCQAAASLWGVSAE